MRKFLIFISSTLILTTTSFNIIGCTPPNNMRTEEVKIPDWVFNMIKNNPNEIQVGYDHYYLINKLSDKADKHQQKDWIDLNQNKNLYLYLPKANNIDEAIKNINIDDSAKTWTINVTTPINWKKINDRTYINETFITQDTVVNGIALMDKLKFEQIKKSNKALTWTEQEKESFEKYATLPPFINPSSKRKNQNWWNANGWEKLLSKEKNLISKSGEKVSQLDLYQLWIKQKIIGMNVPLSLMEKGTFKLQATKINHLFLFQSTPKQAWIANTGNLEIINTPHWGFTMNINNQEKKRIFQTPQLINLKNAFKEKNITDYLKEKNFLSFNEQKTTKFKDYYIK